jgi:hypothetical protein
VAEESTFNEEDESVSESSGLSIGIAFHLAIDCSDMLLCFDDTVEPAEFDRGK